MSTFLVVGFWPERALASKTFPDVLKGHWSIQRLPVSGDGCRLCHNTDAGGDTDLNRYFGYRMQTIYGVRKGVAISLRKALDKVEANRDNSDGDVATDYEEIAVDGTNPNDRNSHRVIQVPSEGGAGGDDGGTGVDFAGGGGEPPLIEEPPPSSDPLPDLPPQMWHGCSIDAAPHSGLPALVALTLLGGVAWRRRRSGNARRVR